MKGNNKQRKTKRNIWRTAAIIFADGEVKDEWGLISQSQGIPFFSS